MSSEERTERPPAETRTAGHERIVHGLAVSPGIAIGPADRIEAERARFQAAVAASTKQLRKLKTKAATLPEAAAEEMGYLLDAHLAMLSSSRLVRGVEQRIGEERRNAEWAVQAEIARI